MTPPNRSTEEIADLIVLKYFAVKMGQYSATVDAMAVDIKEALDNLAAEKDAEIETYRNVTDNYKRQEEIFSMKIHLLEAELKNIRGNAVGNVIAGYLDKIEVMENVINKAIAVTKNANSEIIGIENYFSIDFSIFLSLYEAIEAYKAIK